MYVYVSVHRRTHLRQAMRGLLFAVRSRQYRLVMLVRLQASPAVCPVWFLAFALYDQTAYTIVQAVLLRICSCVHVGLS